MWEFLCFSEQNYTAYMAFHHGYSDEVPTPNDGGSDARLCGYFPRRQHPFHTAAALLARFIT